jgi:hypothetical protein
MYSLKEIENQKAEKAAMMSEFKALENGKPMPQKKLREILDEDTFIEGLKKIITRDYYPELMKIQEYRKWKEESHKTGIGISDLLSQVTEENNQKREVFEKDIDKMTLSQYITKYTR